MSLGSRIAWDDTILPFQLDRSGVRGRLVRLDGALDRMLSQHDYPPAVERLVAEAALLTALIGPAIKLRWKLSLQIRGDGPARLVATDYFAPAQEGDPGRIRAYASHDANRLKPTEASFPQIGNGYFAVLIDQGAGTEPYTGMTPLAGGSLSACAESYFAQSEQLPTRFALAFDKDGQGWRAGGVMIQKMPAASNVSPGASADTDAIPAPERMFENDDALEDWTRAQILLDTVEPEELIGPTVQPTEVLVRLFHEEGPRVFDPKPIQFGCTCSADRVRASLSIYSARDIATMITSEGVVTADCKFCGAHYEFDPDALGLEAGGSPSESG